MITAPTIEPPAPPSAWRPLERHRLEADPTACRVARHLLSTWLTPVPASAELGMDLAIAVNEAVANAVEHAYPATSPDGEVELQMRLGEQPHNRTRWIIVTVTDHGSWRPVPGDKGHRGRGLEMINELTDRRDLTTTSQGTTITMAVRLN